jgi:hypothetical protein
MRQLLLAVVAGLLANGCSGFVQAEYATEQEALSACLKQSRSRVASMSSGEGMLSADKEIADHLVIKLVYCKKSTLLFSQDVGTYHGIVEYEEKLFDESEITIKTMSLGLNEFTYKKY